MGKSVVEIQDRASTSRIGGLFRLEIELAAKPGIVR